MSQLILSLEQAAVNFTLTLTLTDFPFPPSSALMGASDKNSINPSTLVANLNIGASSFGLMLRRSNVQLYL
jgi:hypothetical protein